MKILPIVALGVLIAGTAAFAEQGEPAARTSGAETTDTGAPNTGDDMVLRKRPGRTTYSAASEGGGQPLGQTERKKMEILKPVEAEPLELIDETDPCPTLPC
ncbi:MAG: hypothetical protein E2O92_04980 [Alphaproteobacteria bacterium]|nr:MAG: hypothetical protein E2O92_04980 [Alphaproteobacteria bacterium]